MLLGVNNIDFKTDGKTYTIELWEDEKTIDSTNKYQIEISSDKKEKIMVESVEDVKLMISNLQSCLQYIDEIEEVKDIEIE